MAAVLLGVDPTEILQSVPSSSLPPSASVESGPAIPRADDDLAGFSSVVLADTEDVWTALLQGMGQLQAQQQRVSRTAANQLLVRLELQADCLAGGWAHNAHRARGVLEPGDLEEALGAASAVGDDRLQRRARGTVTPDSFTHGTSAQRASWFRRGFESGIPGACDTFSADRL